jgi:hypothetical protein
MLAGALALAASLGVAGGVLAIASLADFALLLVRSRARRAACKPPTEGNAS